MNNVTTFQLLDVLCQVVASRRTALEERIPHWTHSAGRVLLGSWSQDQAVQSEVRSGHQRMCGGEEKGDGFPVAGIEEGVDTASLSLLYYEGHN